MRFRLENDPGIEIELRRMRRARRLSLRVSSLDGRVTLTVPARAPVAEARAFAEEKGDWIRAARARLPGDIAVAPGVVLPVEGRLLTVVAGPRPALTAGAVVVPEARPGPAARGLLRGLARDRLAESAHRHAARIGCAIAALSLRDTRSRWGSCTTEGRLMFSWRLILAPPEVLDYVAAHEVAHLLHMDHSPAFWTRVDALCPAWRARRAWLRDEGADLHRYRFDG